MEKYINSVEFPIKLLLLFTCFSVLFDEINASEIVTEIRPLRLRVDSRPVEAFPDCRSALMKSWFLIKAASLDAIQAVNSAVLTCTMISHREG